MVDSPDDTDSPDAHKLSAQEAVANSGYFPMPSMLDTGTAATQQKQNGSQSASSSVSVNKQGTGGSGRPVSDYVAAPSHLSSSSLSASSAPTTSTSSSSKSTLASTSAAVAKKSRQLFAKVLPKKSSSTTSPSKGSKTKGGNSSSSQQTKQQQPQPIPPTSILAPPPSADLSTVEPEENDDSDMGDLVDLLDLGEPIEMGTSYNNGVTNGNQSLNPLSDSGQSSGYFKDTSTSGFGALPPMTVPSTLTSDPFIGTTPTAAPPGYFKDTSTSGFGALPPMTVPSTLTSDPFIGTTPTAAPPPPFEPFLEDDDGDAFYLPDLPGDSEMSSTSSGGGVTYSGSIVTFSSGQLPPSKK